MTEIWKPIEGYEGIYEVSDQGRVRNVKRGGRLLSCVKVAHGYIAVSLYKDGKQRMNLVHRLVALAFIPNPENKPQVNHLDGVKEHNTVGNLEWVLPHENIWHAIRTGLKPTIYPDRGGSTLQQLRESHGWSKEELAERSGVQQSTIEHIERDKRFIRTHCITTVYKLARALNVSIETLADFNEGGG